MKSNPRANRPAAATSQRGGTPQRGGAPARGATPRRANVQQTKAFVEGIRDEMKRVTWPSRDQWIGATLLTIALVILVGLFTSACDWIFAELFQLITGSAH